MPVVEELCQLRQKGRESITTISSEIREFSGHKRTCVGWRSTVIELEKIWAAKLTLDVSIRERAVSEKP